VEEQLERQRAADHGVAPRAVVGALRRPAPPVRGRGRQTALDVCARREDQRLLVGGAKRDQRRPGRFYVEAPEDRLVVDLRLAGLPGAERQRVATSEGHRDVPAALEARRRGGVAEGGHDVPAHRDAPGDAVDSPDQLAGWPQIMARQGHRVGDPDHPVAGGERGLQHVAVGQIASRDIRGDLRRQREAPAAIGVQDRREHAGRIEVGQAQPIDRPVTCHQRGGPPVPDRGVVSDRDVAPRRRARRRDCPRPLGAPAHRRRCTSRGSLAGKRLVFPHAGLHDEAVTQRAAAALSSLTIGVCIVSIAFGDRSSEPFGLMSHIYLAPCPRCGRDIASRGPPSSRRAFGSGSPALLSARSSFSVIWSRLRAVL
jgi:hypothetical protein